MRPANSMGLILPIYIRPTKNIGRAHSKCVWLETQQEMIQISPIWQPYCNYIPAANIRHVLVKTAANIIFQTPLPRLIFSRQEHHSHHLRSPSTTAIVKSIVHNRHNFDRAAINLNHLLQYTITTPLETSITATMTTTIAATTHWWTAVGIHIH